MNTRTVFATSLMYATLSLAPFPTFAVAQAVDHPVLKPRVAVVSLSDDALKVTTDQYPGGDETTVDIPPPEGFALGLTEMLTTALVQSERFVVLERALIDRMLAEQDFGASGRVNPETAPKLGQAIGAQALISGAITEYSYTASKLGGAISLLKGANVSARQVKAVVGIDIRVLDSATGEVVASHRGQGEATAKMLAADVTVAEHSFSSELNKSTPLGRASRAAISQVVSDLVDELGAMEWTGRIIDVRDDKIYINAGAESGIRVGMQLDVYRQEEPLIDPATGQNLGAPERHIGAIRVVQVEDRYAVAEAVDGEGFARNALLRFVGDSPKP